MSACRAALRADLLRDPRTGCGGAALAPHAPSASCTAPSRDSTDRLEAVSGGRDVGEGHGSGIDGPDPTDAAGREQVGDGRSQPTGTFDHDVRAVPTPEGVRVVLEQADSASVRLEPFAGRPVALGQRVLGERVGQQTARAELREQGNDVVDRDALRAGPRQHPGGVPRSVKGGQQVGCGLGRAGHQDSAARIQPDLHGL